MATITISSAAYNDAKQFAETQNLSVDEFIVSLINKFALSRQGKKKYKIQPLKSVTYSACQSLGSSMLMISMVIRHVWSITKKNTDYESFHRHKRSYRFCRQA